MWRNKDMSWWWPFGSRQENLEEDEEILIKIYETIKTIIIPCINANERTQALNNVNIILGESLKITNRGIKSQLSQLIARLNVLVEEGSRQSTEVITQIQKIIHRNVPGIYQKLLQEYKLLKEIKREIEKSIPFFENIRYLREAKECISTLSGLIRRIQDESIKSKLLKLIEKLHQKFLSYEFSEAQKILTDIISTIDEQLGKIDKLKI